MLPAPDPRISAAHRPRAACSALHRKPPGVARAPRKGSLFPWANPGDPWSLCTPRGQGQSHRHSAFLLPSSSKGRRRGS